MRITSGLYRGRLLTVPPGDRIRPTGDRMRQAIFNILQAYALPGGAVVLDAFCGSGALGLEALSRGAEKVIFMDTDVTCCEKNIAALKINSGTAVLRRDVTKPGPAREAVGLVFLDPPYGQDLLAPALTALAANGWLAPEAIAVCETERDHTGDIPAGFALLDRRDYGAACLHLCRYAG